MLAVELARGADHFVDNTVAVQRSVGQAGFLLRHIVNSWVDLQQKLEGGPIGIPGALDFELRSLSMALGDYDAAFRVEWPNREYDRHQEMSIGWRMYEQAEPLQSAEFRVLREHMEAKCRAVHQLFRWLTQQSQGRRVREWWEIGH